MVKDYPYLTLTCPLLVPRGVAAKQMWGARVFLRMLLGDGPVMGMLETGDRVKVNWR
jgi:hypothetical protein